MKLLYDYLVPFRVSEEYLEKEFASAKFLEKRMLGFYTQTATTFAIWLPLFEGYSCMISPMHNSPFVDLGVAAVSAELRRQVLTLTAMANECSYCAAHSCGMGNAFTGSAIDKESIRILPEELTEKERCAMRLVVASMKIPSRVADKMRKDVISYYGESGFQNIVTIMAWMGFMSCMTDTLGCELERPSQLHASRVITKAGWIPDHAVRTEETTTYSTAAEAPQNTYWISKIFSPVTSFLELGRNVSAASAQTEKLLSRIPTTPDALDQFYVSLLGFLPFYIKELGSLSVKRVLAHNFHLLILANPEDFTDEESKNRGTLQRDLKIRSAYVFFTAAQNYYMASHMATIARKYGITSESLNSALETGKNFSTANPKRNLEVNLYMVSYVTAQRKREILHTLTPDIFDLSKQNPVTCLEIVALLSFCSLLQRLSSAIVDGSVYEEEVNSVVESDYGNVLNLQVGRIPIYDEVEYKVMSLWGGCVEY